MTNKQLQSLCRTWQKRLRLQDWAIKCRFAASQRESGHAWGESEISLTLKRGRIYICPDDEVDPDWLGNPDPETTLVHELLHFHGAHYEPLFKDNNLANKMLETAIDSIAEALVKGYRR